MAAPPPPDHDAFTAASAARLAAVLSTTSAGIALLDPHDRIRMANDWFRNAFDIAPGEFPTWEEMMRHCHASRRGLVIEDPDIEGWLARVRGKFRSAPVRMFQSDLADGRWVWVVETVHDDAWMSMVVSDVSPLKANESVLRRARDDAVRMSMKDPLTDLHNRRYIMGHLAEMLGSAQAMRWPLTLVLLDIDHFKHINDSAGHDVGDAVLRHFARLLHDQLRPMDAVGRIGGEEFMLVLPNTELEDATHILRRVRGLIAESTLASHQPLPTYTFSAGLAMAGPQDVVEELFRRADQALLRAKREGRNRDWAHNSRSMRL